MKALCLSAGNKRHSIAELLDDPIAELLMKSDGVNRCALQRQLARMARFHAGIRAGEPI